VTEPASSLEQRASLEQRTAELQRQADDAMRHLRTRVAGVREAQQQAMRATGEATSRDGVVRAVVDGTGVVTSLTFAPTAFERSTPDRLAQTAVATIQAAAAQARGRTAEAMAAIRADDGGLVDSAAQGAAALGVPPLPVPDVPRTAVDPTAEPSPWDAEPEPRHSTWDEVGQGDPDPAPAGQGQVDQGHVDQVVPRMEPAPGPVASNRSPRPTGEGNDGADDWSSDERPW
jgi:DNA-binding protein YbaB